MLCSTVQCLCNKLQVYCTDTKPCQFLADILPPISIFSQSEPTGGLLCRVHVQERQGAAGTGQASPTTTTTPTNPRFLYKLSFVFNLQLRSCLALQYVCTKNSTWDAQSHIGILRLRFQNNLKKNIMNECLT